MDIGRTMLNNHLPRHRCVNQKKNRNPVSYFHLRYHPITVEIQLWFVKDIEKLSHRRQSENKCAKGFLGILLQFAPSFPFPQLSLCIQQAKTHLTDQGPIAQYLALLLNPCKFPSPRTRTRTGGKFKTHWLLDCHLHYVKCLLVAQVMVHFAVYNPCVQAGCWHIWNDGRGARLRHRHSSIREGSRPRSKGRLCWR